MTAALTASGLVTHRMQAAFDPLLAHFGPQAAECAAYAAEQQAAAAKALAAILAPVLAQGELGGMGRYFPELNASFNRDQRLGMALQTGNRQSWQALLERRGWTERQLEALLHSLNAEEWLAVQKIWDYFSGWRTPLAVLALRLYGQAPDWPPPCSFKVATRTATGDRLEVRLHGGDYPLKVNTALLDSLDGVYAESNALIYELAWREWLIDSHRLLSLKGLADYYGQPQLAAFKQQVRQVMAGDAGLEAAHEAPSS